MLRAITFSVLYITVLKGLQLCRYELGRQPGNTKLSSNVTVRRVRVRGGNFKFRALRLDTGNFSWGSEVKRQLHFFGQQLSIQVTSLVC